MKEKIYTIPLNEAVDENTECPFCFLAQRLERESVEYTLGAAMMEPDYRILCNEKGFCNKHANMLFKMPNKLSLALILDSQLEEIRKKYVMPNVEKKETGFLKRKKREIIEKPSCIICEKTNTTIRRYAEVFFWMWKNDDDFKNKILSSKGFCIPHFSYLCSIAREELKNPLEFTEPMYEKQKAELLRLQEEIHLFTLKFDYRNKDLPWGNAKDSPERVLSKTVGYLIKDEEEN